MSAVSRSPSSHSQAHGRGNPRSNSSSIDRRPNLSAQPAKLRCAIYTRVSTEHGLDQAFNSLDAQREACEAYVKSQAHEGWRPLPDRYDDGGYSGGSIDRPDLQRLLAAVRRREIDIVVVYKVHRLTRSLADFAKLVELFDGHKVAFVSVTQAFNTTSSMGRLTLNVLLSFAQFEREVTGERIRDKIAASKRKGLRMGGPTPLGYVTKDKSLVVDAMEAEQVRWIFDRYLELRSLAKLIEAMDAKEIVTKVTHLRDGHVRGGVRFRKGALAYLLRNRIYVGEIRHKAQHFQSVHPAIIDKELFEAVQDALKTTHQAKARQSSYAAPLKGRIFDDRGNRMTPMTAVKNGARHRYYVSAALNEGRRREAGSVARVRAVDIETTVVEAMQARGDNAMSAPSFASQIPMPPQRDESEHLDDLNREGGHYASFAILSAVARVTIKADRIEIALNAPNGSETDTHWDDDGGRSSGANSQPPIEPDITIAWRPAQKMRRREIIAAAGAPPPAPIRAETRARLIESIAKARVWLDDLVTGRVTSTNEIAKAENCSERSVRTTLNLAFLSPATVKAATAGTLPRDLGVARLNRIPTEWQ